MSFNCFSDINAEDAVILYRTADETVYRMGGMIRGCDNETQTQNYSFPIQVSSTQVVPDGGLSLSVPQTALIAVFLTLAICLWLR